MQKRGRAVETQKLKRTMKRGKTTAIRESAGCSWGYIKLIASWLMIVSMDAFIGTRLELLWPSFTLVCSMVESMQRRSSLVQLTSQTHSFLFLCLTATSDLICYLFIPVRLLIFLATTYVWVNSVWHVNGGLLTTIKTIFGEKTQAAPIVFLWAYFVIFEIFCRMRCDYLIFLKYLPFSGWLEDADSCMRIQGMHPGWAAAFNAFFSCHCIGYPLIVIFFHVNYCYNEWRLRLQQGDVSDENESLFRLLANSIPMEFDATRMYRRLDYLEDECLDDDYLELSSRDVLLPIEAPPDKKKLQFEEEFPNGHLSSYEQLRLLGAWGPTVEARRYGDKTSEKQKSVAAPTTENGGGITSGGGACSSSNGVVHRRDKGARPSISSKSSRANGKLPSQHHQQLQQQHANGLQRRQERRGEGKEEEGAEDWPDSSSSDAEVQLHRRRETRSAPLVVRMVVAAVTGFLDVLALIASGIPFVRHLEWRMEGRKEQQREAGEYEEDDIHAAPAFRCFKPMPQQHLPNGKSPSPQTTPTSQLSTPPRRSAAAAAANGKANGVNGLDSGGGSSSRRRMANGDHASNGAAAAGGGGRSSRSNGLGVSHHDVDVASGLLRDVSRESARTQHSEESEQSRGGGGRMCGAECGKLASEVARLRAEVRHVRQAEEAARLAASNCIISEKNVASECSQMRKQIEQLMNKVSSIERQREKESKTAEVAERKAAESAARAAELEAELQKERVARREERERGREKSETVSETQQLLREKEAAWEREAERLRVDSRTKDEVIIEMQGELTKLRVVAKNAAEAEDLRAELSLLREKTVHLEENLAEENKLKQELFRALRSTQAERDRARQYDYSSSSSFYPLSPSLGSPGSNGTHSVPLAGGGSGAAGYSSPDLSQQQQLHATGGGLSSCAAAAAEQAFAGAGKHSYSFASPSPFLSASSTGQHTLFEPLPMPPSQKNLGYPLVGEDHLLEEDGEPFYAQNCGKFGAPSPASARTTTSS